MPQTLVSKSAMASPELQLLLATLGGLRHEANADDANRTRGTATALMRRRAGQFTAMINDASAAASAHLAAQMQTTGVSSIPKLAAPYEPCCPLQCVRADVAAGLVADIAAGNHGAALRAAAQRGILPPGRSGNVLHTDEQISAARDRAASYGSDAGAQGGSGASGDSGDLAAYMREAQGCAAACVRGGEPPGAAADALRLLPALAAAAASLLLFLQANLTGCVRHCQTDGRHDTTLQRSQHLAACRVCQHQFVNPPPLPVWRAQAATGWGARQPD